MKLGKGVREKHDVFCMKLCDVFAIMNPSEHLCKLGLTLVLF